MLFPELRYFGMCASRVRVLKLRLNRKGALHISCSFAFVRLISFVLESAAREIFQEFS